jgi:alpha-tubulin suppressor-like RCC1 family protein
MKLKNAARMLAVAVVGLVAVLVGPSSQQVSAQTTPLVATGLGLLDFGRSCALTSSGAVHCWAYGARLNGNGSTDPILVAGNAITGAAKIADGRFQHVCALMTDATVQCWGNNNNGQVGLGATSTSTASGQVVGVAGATNIGVGLYHSCAVITGGSVKCWGMNLTGQIGNGLTAIAAPTAVQVPGLTGVTQLALGRDHTCALLGDGTVTCWGSNQVLQLALPGTVLSRFVPTPISNVTGVVQIAAVNQQTCALLANGTVTCWGGYGTYSTPTNVAGLSGATQITGGVAHYCAIVANGSVKCWGLNNYGQLGNGTTTNVDVALPVSVSALTGAVAIAAGGNHTCALLAGGAVSCWGYGAGDSSGLSENSAVPVPVSGFGTSATTSSTTTTATASTTTTSITTTTTSAPPTDSPATPPAASNQQDTTTTKPAAEESATTSTTIVQQLVYLPIENPTTTKLIAATVTTTSVATAGLPAATSTATPTTTTKAPIVSSPATTQPPVTTTTAAPISPVKLRRVCRTIIKNRKRVLTCKLSRV